MKYKGYKINDDLLMFWFGYSSFLGVAFSGFNILFLPIFIIISLITWKWMLDEEIERNERRFKNETRNKTY